MSKNEESFPTVIGRVRDTMPCPTLAFPGGEVTPRKPAAAELVLSAKQWATAVHEHFVDHYQNIGHDKSDHMHTDARMLSYLRHLEGRLLELEDMCRE